MISRSYFIIILILLSYSEVIAQKISGKITDADNGKALNNVNIKVNKTTLGSFSDDNGNYEIKLIQYGDYSLTISCIGYQTITTSFKIGADNDINLDFQMQKLLIETNPVVITATRTNQYAANVPARIQIINKTQIESIPSPDIDVCLAFIPGININRTLGIFSNKSIVSMRGLSGKDQSRTLVMIDGIPINKTDGGSVNWNLFSKNYVDKMEISKGPISSLYGSNAMGGAINIITRQPLKKFEGNIELSYGTYNTKSINLSLGEKSFLNTFKGFYWLLSGFGTKSDGYISQTPINITPYTVKSYLNEGGTNLKFGYQINKKQSLETNFTFYDDERGGGETVYEEKGNYTQHQTYHTRTSYKYSSDKINAIVNVFYLRENYKAVNEYIKDATYTLYDVDSKRTDVGATISLSNKIDKSNLLSFGIDIKQGNVDAADIYYTSTDKINNQGRMNFAAMFVQDEWDLIKYKLKIVAGLRLDYAKYFDGAFTIDSPSESNNYMNIYQIQSIPNADFNSLSPKMSLLYKLNDKANFYGSYSIGFRPPTLDDMCRSGKIKGGFKVVNPYLKPETLTNFELGMTYNFKNLQITPSVYYSIGKDFMYFVSTGDSVNPGFPVSPVFQSRNISKVVIYGFETGINYIFNNHITAFANYSYSHSQIKEYQIISPNDNNLTNKFLTDVPENNVSFGILWENKIVNITFTAKYIGKKWVNDTNTPDDKYGLDAQYPDYFLFDINLKKQIYSFMDTRISVENAFDKIIYDSKNLLGCGRFITIGINLKY